MRNSIHRFFYVALLCFLAASMTTSVYCTNMAWVFLFANWVLEWNWREKFADFRHNRPLHAILAVAGVTLLWSIGTNDLSRTLYVLQVGLPFLAIPLVVLTTAPLRRREALCVAVCYVGAILVMTVVGFVRYLTIPDLPYRNIVPHISHIRFGLHLCLCIVLFLSPCTARGNRLLQAAGILLALWCLVFLFLLHAYTAFIILLVLAVAMPLIHWRRFSRRVRWVVLATGIAAWALVIASTLYYHHEYYTLRSPSADTDRPMVTANGNPYAYSKDYFIENGNYVQQYVCEQELRQQWARVSDLPIDSLTPVGYTVYPALVRYLNALGTTKDSLGMTLLSPDDVAAIERGIANPVYLQRGPCKLFYVLFFEYENYRCYRNVNNFSTLQRIELWRAGWTMHTRSLLWGYGTGGIQHDLNIELLKSQSPLAGSDFHLHNQYLTFLVAFGWLGFLIIAFFYLRVFIPRRVPRPSLLFTAHTIIVLVSFMADNTLATLAGITFVTLGFSLFSQIDASSKSQEVRCHH